MRKRRLVLLLAIPVAALVAAVPVALRRPSNERVWTPEQARLPHVVFLGDTAVRIGNVRDFLWRSDSSSTPGWEDRVYDLRRLNRVYFVLSPFARAWRGPAHTFLSFEFDDSSTVAVSVEARRETGEQYSALQGILRRFEIMVVVGEERDLIGLRAAVWGDPVYLYPLRATRDSTRLLFMRMLRRAQQLETRPEFYNTLTSNCATNLVDAVNAFAPHHIRSSFELLLPGYSDALAYRLGLLDTRLPLEQARLRFRVSRHVLPTSEQRDFSIRIRQP